MFLLGLAAILAGCGPVDDARVVAEREGPAGAEATRPAQAPLAAGSHWIDRSERGVSLRAAPHRKHRIALESYYATAVLSDRLEDCCKILAHETA